MILPVDINGAEATIKTKITQLFMVLKPANDVDQSFTTFRSDRRHDGCGWRTCVSLTVETNFDRRQSSTPEKCEDVCVCRKSAQALYGWMREEVGQQREGELKPPVLTHSFSPVI